MDLLFRPQGNVHRYFISLILAALLPVSTACGDALPIAQNCSALLKLASTPTVHAQEEAFAQAEYPTYPNLVDSYLKALSFAQRFSDDRPMVSLVIPAYKEELRLTDSIAQLQSFFDAFPFPVEILVRVEKSPDHTAEVAKTLTEDDPRFKTTPHPVQKGKGYAVRQGVLAAKGHFILFMDADLSTPLPEIFHFLNLAEQWPETDVLIGDRHQPESQIGHDQGQARQFMGRVFRALTTSSLKVVGLKGICDTQCGFKMFTRQAGRHIFVNAQSNGFAFDIEALLLAVQLGYNVRASAIQWNDDERSTVHPFKDPIMMMVDMAKIQWRIRHNQEYINLEDTKE